MKMQKFGKFVKKNLKINHRKNNRKVIKIFVKLKTIIIIQGNIKMLQVVCLICNINHLKKFL